MAQEMWEAVKSHVEDNLSSVCTPPFSAMDLINRIHMDEDVETIKTELSKKMRETLPSYQGEYEYWSITQRVPSMRRPLTGRDG